MLFITRLGVTVYIRASGVYTEQIESLIVRVLVDLFRVYRAQVIVYILAELVYRPIPAMRETWKCLPTHFTPSSTVAKGNNIINS